MPEYVTDEACHDRSAGILAAIQSLDDRLYKDNGRVSIQTRLDRHERMLCGIGRLAWAIVLAIVALVVPAAVIAWRG